MSNRRLTLTMVLILAAAGAPRQVGAADKAITYKTQNDRLKAVLNRIPEKYRERLSGASRNLLARVNGTSELPSRPGAIAHDSAEEGDAGAVPRPSVPATTTAPALGAGRVFGAISDSSTDLAFSRLAGFTQNETSTAWCGNVALVGYNDSGSLFETLNIPGIGISFSGVARSTDRGRTFADLGFLNPGSNVDVQLNGDPVVACTDPGTFYYSNIAADFGPFTGAVSVSKSTDGGLSFGDPVKAVEKSFDTHFIDKDWMTADPTNSNNLYVTYTDFDFSGDVCGFDGSAFPIFREGIELVRSTDGGTTWSAPVQVSSAAESCTTTGATQGSQVVVGGNGSVYVAWEQFTLTGIEIRIATSTSGGVSFGASVKVNDVNEAGELGDLQGSIRINEFPTLAVDRSGGSRDGTLYLAWNDGNIVGFDGVFGLDYGFTDILATHSSDAGGTWSSPVRVNGNVEPLTSPSVAGRGTDQFMPGIAVDSYGAVGICYYDRRSDPTNFLIDRRCARSFNGGTSWQSLNFRFNAQSFMSVTNQDLFLATDYMGDYDSLASDFTRAHRGFVGGYGDNESGQPDVKSNKF